MMADMDPGIDAASTDARKKKKSSKHRTEGEDGERKSRRKKSEPQTEAGPSESVEADKKKKKKKHREDETAEEREERRRRKREKKQVKLETEGEAPGLDEIPAMDDVDDATPQEPNLAAPLMEPLGELDGGHFEEVVQVRPEEKQEVPPPPGLKPKPKPKPKPAPKQQRPEPVQQHPEPVQQRPEPVQQHPEPVQQHPEPVQQHPEPVQQHPEPMQQHPEPMQQHPEPMQQHPEPMQQHPEPMQQHPEPMQQHPEPVQQHPEPIEHHPEYLGEAPRQPTEKPRDPMALHQYIASTLEDSDDELTPIDAPGSQQPTQDEPPESPAIEVDVRVEQHEDPEQRFSQMVEEDLTARNAEQETPAEIPEGKKSGGLLGKLFASFRRSGSKRKQLSKKPAAEPAPPVQEEPEEQAGLAEQGRWRSNPSMFNPNETPGNTLQPGDVQQPEQQPEPQTELQAETGEQRPEDQQPPVAGEQPAPPAVEPQPQPQPQLQARRPIPESEVRVILLDGEEISVPIARKATGAELIVKVCEYVDLVETDYFGLTYVDSKERMWFWVDAEKKILKQLKHCESRLLNFQVKFYPPEPNLLVADVTRYQLCLQVRQDIYTGKLPCTWVTQALLGSFQVQSELGDFDENDHGVVGSTEYLQNFEFVHNQTPELVSKIAELHRGHNGITPEVADLRYLETARRLEFYGVDLHPARDLDDVDITLGVCFGGVLVYKDRMRISRFAWPKILRISYRKNLFYLKIRSDMYENVEAVIGFKLMNHRWAKRLWKIAVENHSFFRLKEAQMQKTGSKASLNFIRGSSAHRYSGRTMYQYRTQGGTMRQSGTFDRSLSKRTSASLPSLKGSQYGSFHSLNRAHPRDMRPVTSKPRAENPRSGSVSVLQTSAFNRRPSRTPSQASDDLL